LPGGTQLHTEGSPAEQNDEGLPGNRHWSERKLDSPLGSKGGQRRSR
jgi:hypothetical protein